MEPIEYYKEYAEMKLSLSKGKRTYISGVALKTRWNKEPEAHKAIFNHMQEKYLFPDFVKILLSNFLNDSRFFLRDLIDKEANIVYRKFKEYLGNPAEYFKQDLRNVNRVDGIVDFLTGLYDFKTCYFLTAYFLYTSGLMPPEIPEDFYKKILLLENYYNTKKLKEHKDEIKKIYREYFSQDQQEGV